MRALTRFAAVTLVVTLAACTSDAAPDASGATASGAAYIVASGGPENGRYGLGAAPAAERLASWDSDILADGSNLPAGRGSVAEGRALFAQQCASCHGARGEGMEPAFPRLVGRPAAGESFAFADDPATPRTIGNYWSHATTLYDYVRRAMPLLTPGTLSDDQTYALTAYLLAENAVIPQDAVLDAAALRAVEMPARNRFVPDDRRGGPGVR
jgi:mono/diheme cytochrome c family protein